MDNAQCTGNYFIYSIQKKLVKTYEKKKRFRHVYQCVILQFLLSM